MIFQFECAFFIFKNQSSGDINFFTNFDSQSLVINEEQTSSKKSLNNFSTKKSKKNTK